MASGAVTKQRVFVHFDDERNDILKFTVDSSARSSAGNIMCEESIEILQSLKDIYTFVSTHIDNLGSNFELELFDVQTGQFTSLIDNWKEDNSCQFANTKMLRLLVRCHSAGAVPGELVAIDGRKFGNSPLIIGSREVAIGEQHQSDAPAADTAIGVDGDTGLQCWDSAFIMAKFLEKHKDTYVVGKNVLEIGSGTGIVAIVCQLLTEAPLDQDGTGGWGTQTDAPGLIIATDLPYTMANIEANIHRNSVPGGNGSKLEAFVLDWNAPADLYAPGDATGAGGRKPLALWYDVILCSDVIWLEHLIPALVETLAHHASPNPFSNSESDPRLPVILLAHQVRFINSLHFCLFCFCLVNVLSYHASCCGVL